MSRVDDEVDEPEADEHDLYLRDLLTKGVSDDLDALMSVPWGRRLAFWLIFDLSKFYGSVFDPNVKHEATVVAALKDGRRNVGRDLFELVNAIAPDQFDVMVQEHTKSRGTDIRARELRKKFFRGIE